ncbi:hypothetical protein PH7735_02477 [Shimia thalassica]|uniref:Uncharacterized protein n=1 Tax=Shimia thalassica TaxID=1715693 RepID=A0A0P1IS28_9RHOB|nr:hypothetical protein PH7735_02477 [Shimia thalassica]
MSGYKPFLKQTCRKTGQRFRVGVAARPKVETLQAPNRDEKKTECNLQNGCRVGNCAVLSVSLVKKEARLSG